ncbi:MAG: type II toxin-antitoxin system VapC family toxin [Streptosporangiaceae bacterium]
MSVFVDTSALYALLDEDDANHKRAAASWQRLVDTSTLTTHAYVVVELSALTQRRLGMDAVARLHRALLPVVRQWTVDAHTHGRAVERWLAQSRRGLSLVDMTSFVMMGDRRLFWAFAYDEDFDSAGFDTRVERWVHSAGQEGGKQ